MSRAHLVRRTGEVVAHRPLGAYRQLSVALPALTAPVRPGQFVVVPPARSDTVLSRTWWVSGERTEPGFGTTLELVVPQEEEAPALPEAGESLDLTGPLGRGFGLPTSAVPVVVVAQGVAGAAGRWLAQRLQAAGCTVHLVSCAPDPERHVDLVLARRSADSVVLTDPVDAGEVVADVARRAVASVMYAVGPVSLSATVSRVAAQAGIVCQVSALDIGSETVCGHGLCGACDLPLVAPRGATVRPCAQGPVLRGDLVAWEQGS